VTGSEIALAEATAAAASLQEALPRSLHPLFGGSFLRSWDLYDEFVYRLTLRVFEGGGLETATREPGTTSDVAARAGLEPGRALIPLDWILQLLATRHILEREHAAEGIRWRRTPGPLPALALDPIREEQAGLDPSWLPAYTLAETVARDYVRFLRGEVTGEEILFSPARFRLWIDYFSNANGLYAVNNRVGAIAVAEWLPYPEATILELGGGLASAACALLEELDAAGRLGALGAYHFTELVPAFLRRGQQALHTRFPDLPGLTFGLLDMNRPFEPQGVAPGSRSVVYAVNTLHVARDLDFTLGEIRTALEPGGRLIVSECVRMQPGQPLNAEFIFNLMATFRSRRPDTPGQPPAGFLLPEQWKAALEAAGFTALRFLPDVPTFSERFPRFHAAAIGATRP
jgi:SAM-dependent methyltransferase